MTYWRGILLATLLTAATIWLAASGRLGLYIHPRYFVFTVIMASIGGIAVLAAFIVRRRREDAHADHDHDHDQPAPRSRLGGWLSIAASAVIVLVAAVALVALPPTTLSASLAGDREVNASIDLGDEAPTLVGGDTSEFTVKDWAVLIRQGGSDAVLRSATPTITGFVVPIEGRSDAFSIARYSITCCAVDAQPFGVTVVMPGWEDDFAAGDWVSATGRFVENPDASATATWALESTETVAIDEPSDPYVF